MKNNIKEALESCTTNKCWVCVVEGRFLKSAKGRCGWATKAAATLAFKSSPYWLKVCQDLKTEHPEKTSESYWGGRDWNSRSIQKSMEDTKYKELVESDMVHIYEIKITPEWIK